MFNYFLWYSFVTFVRLLLKGFYSMSILWVITAIFSAISAFLFVVGITTTTSAPQEAAMAAMCLVIAIVPYCFTRAIQQMLPVKVEPTEEELAYQTKAIFLMEKLLSEKTGSIIDESYYYQTNALKKAQQIAVSGVINEDGTVHVDKVAELAKLEKTHRNEARSIGNDPLAKKLYIGFIDELANTLDEVQRKEFGKIYNMMRSLG